MVGCFDLAWFLGGGGCLVAPCSWRRLGRFLVPLLLCLVLRSGLDRRCGRRCRRVLFRRLAIVCWSHLGTLSDSPRSLFGLGRGFYLGLVGMTQWLGDCRRRLRLLSRPLVRFLVLLLRSCSGCLVFAGLRRPDRMRRTSGPMS